MEPEANFNVKAYCEECGVPSPEPFIERCEQLRILLEEANKTINLTRITSPADYWDKHVADSLAAAKYFPELRTKQFTLLDLGCGAGFPSLILAAAFPNLKVTAMDSTTKKVAFVARAAKELGIKNLNALQSRAREAGHRREHRGRYHIITARAVGEAVNLYEEVCNLVAEHATLILYKTPEQIAKELPAAQECFAKQRDGIFTWGSTEPFTLPGGGGSRCFLHARYEAS